MVGANVFTTDIRKMQVFGVYGGDFANDLWHVRNRSQSRFDCIAATRYNRMTP